MRASRAGRRAGRYGLVRVRENAESIAFYSGEAAEGRLLFERLGAVVANYVQLIRTSRNLEFFTSFYRRGPPLPHPTTTKGLHNLAHGCMMSGKLRAGSDERAHREGGGREAECEPRSGQVPDPDPAGGGGGAALLPRPDRLRRHQPVVVGLQPHPL